MEKRITGFIQFSLMNLIRKTPVRIEQTLEPLLYSESRTCGWAVIDGAEGKPQFAVEMAMRIKDVDGMESRTYVMTDLCVAPVYADDSRLMQTCGLLGVPFVYMPN